MPFIPHTEDDVRQMLAAIGVERIADLYDEIPAELLRDGVEGVPEGLPEAEVLRLAAARAAGDAGLLSFLGAGAYEHHIPAAVWQLATRGEFYTAYTPYQPEASQGTLQVIYEFQSMMTALTAMEVANASLYDGASALGEAVLMAVRAHRRSKSRTVLVPRSLHPHWRAVLRALTEPQRIVVEEIPFDLTRGVTDPEALAAWAGRDITAVVIPQPNFFGMLEEVDALTDWAHAQGAMAIAAVNPVALAVLEPPGRWGGKGVDIVVGEGQPLGVPLSSGGPYFGFLCTRKALVRQMPGRLVGRTVDTDGREGFVLTLQAREQHIRRSKATSNICTNQGLMVTAATIHMALLGPEGLRRVAAASHNNTHALAQRLCAIEGVERRFDGPVFHEVTLRLPRPPAAVLQRLLEAGILGGLELGRYYPELDDTLLVCATETKREAELERYAGALAGVLDGA
jgi:glycine dehydrogenase subunit 1